MLENEAEAEERAMSLAEIVSDKLNARMNTGLTPVVRSYLLLPPEHRRLNHLTAIYEALKPMGVFAKIPHCDTREMAFELMRTATLLTYPEKANLFSTGDPGDCFYIVLEGSIRVWVVDFANGRELNLAIVRAVNVVGERAVETQGKRTAHGTVHDSGAVLLRIGVEAFWSAITPFLERINNDRASVLSRVSVLQDLDPDVIKEMATKTSVRTYQPNHCICNQGVVLTEAFVILRGEAMITQTVWMDAPPARIPVTVSRDELGRMHCHKSAHPPASAATNNHHHSHRQQQQQQQQQHHSSNSNSNNSNSNQTSNNNKPSPRRSLITGQQQQQQQTPGGGGSGFTGGSGSVSSSSNNNNNLPHTTPRRTVSDPLSPRSSGTDGEESQRRWYSLPQEDKAQVHDQESRVHQMAATARNWYDLQANFRRPTDGPRVPFPLTYTAHGITLHLQTVELGRAWRKEMLGECALFSKPKEQSYTAIAVTRVEVLVLTRPELCKFICDADMAKIEARLAKASAQADLKQRSSQIKSIVSEYMTWSDIKTSLVEDIRHQYLDREHLRRMACNFETHCYREPTHLKKRVVLPAVSKQQAQMLESSTSLTPRRRGGAVNRKHLDSLQLTPRKGDTVVTTAAAPAAAQEETLQLSTPRKPHKTTRAS